MPVFEATRNRRTPVFVDNFRARFLDPIGVAYGEHWDIGAWTTMALGSGVEWLGNLTLWRHEARPFDRSLAPVLQASADQAAIAVGHAALFNELEAAGELQTATGEVLRLISANPGDLRAVFDGILQRAVTPCEADCGSVSLIPETRTRPVRRVPRQETHDRRTGAVERTAV